MKKKLVSMLLVFVLALGIVTPALAAGPTFSDVPSTYWGYADIEAVAEAGLMKGTGNGEFSPEVKVSVAQFLTLLGRLVFPDVKADGADWFSPYVTAAQNAKLLDGTQVDTNNVEAEISRYDMAVILRAAAKKLGVAEKVAQQSEVKDYLDIPTRYADAVLAVYGMGLIRGDQAGNFNGSNTMMRAEVATVIMRLARATGNQGGNTTEPENPSDPKDDPLVAYEFKGNVRMTKHAMSAPAYDEHIYIPKATLKLYYTPDGGKTSTLVAEGIAAEGKKRVLPNGVEYWDNVGDFTLTFEAPESWGKGKNFYMSAEAVYEGQRLVTSDLRTDGRDYKDLVEVTPGSSVRGTGFRIFNVEMTPPTGEKFKFTYQGHVHGFIDPDHFYDPMPNFTVQLHLSDGRLVAEAVSQEDGSFSMECEVDALDGAFNGYAEMYYITASGDFQGNQYERTGKYRDSDELNLVSLVDLDVWISVGSGMNQEPDDSVGIYKLDKVQ